MRLPAAFNEKNFLVGARLLSRTALLCCPAAIITVHHIARRRSSLIGSWADLLLHQAHPTTKEEARSAPAHHAGPCKASLSMLDEDAPAHSCGQHRGLSGGRLLARGVVRHAGSGGGCVSRGRESDWTATIKPAGPPRCPTSSS